MIVLLLLFLACFTDIYLFIYLYVFLIGYPACPHTLCDYEQEMEIKVICHYYYSYKN
jgi:hypothetical protein